MPVSPEALLISAVLKGGDPRTVMQAGITADMFHTYDEEWTWIEQYFAKHKKAPSKVSFKNVFEDFKFNRATSDTDLPHFCDEVRSSHVKHMLTDAMTKAAEFISDGDIDSAVRSMTSIMIGVTAQIGAVGDSDIFSDYADILSEVESRRERAESEGSSGVPSSLDTINERLGGYNPGELIVISARLGQGKSWMMQAEAAAASLAGYTVLFDALEQTRAQVGMRIHSLMSGSMGREVFNNVALMKGKGYNPVAYRSFLKDMKQHVSGKMHVSDASRGQVSPLTVQTQIERHKPDIVYIDYITLMKRQAADWQGIAQLSGELKQLAAAYQIPIVAAAQLNRADGAGKGEPPDAEALAGSDAIGQDADVLITSRQRSASTIQMKMAKNRNGPGGFMWWVEFRPGEGIYREVSHKRAMELQDKDIDDATAQESRA